MQQQPQQYKTPYHFTHIQNLLSSIIKPPAQKYETIILTQRTSSIVFSILSEPQIFSYGYKKIILPHQINPYMDYDEVVLVVALAGEEEVEELSRFCSRVDKVCLVNLGVSTQEVKVRLKKLEFKNKNSIKSYKQQNLDFQSYLHNVFILSTRRPHKKTQKKQKKQISSTTATQSTSIDRLCSFLCSYQNFSQFQFYLPKNREGLGKTIQQILTNKLSILSKYNYKGLDKNQGMSATKTKVIILERTQQLSPFILDLIYGPLVEELSVGQSCRFVSAHSVIYNTMYCMDLLSASKCLQVLVKDLSQNKEKQINSTDFVQTKKILEKAYNPNYSKQQLSFHQTLMNEINKYMQKNCELLVLQQNIANKINENGQQMKGSKIVQDVFNWCNQDKNKQKYQEYLGLVLLALTVHGFWWFQRNQLVAGISDKDDLEAVKKYMKKINKHNLKQVPPKIQDGSQVRQRCFRHSPNIVEQLKKIQNEIKQKKFETCQVLKVSKGQSGSLAKKTRTVVYINDTIGYNELSLLVGFNKDNYEFVCKDIVNTRQWTDLQLHSH